MSVDLMRLCWRVEFPTPAMSAVAVKLADCANDDGENVYPSVPRVERETRLGASTVRRVIAAFEQAGLLEVVSEATGNKWNRSTTIRRFNMGRLHDLTAVEMKQAGKVTLAPSTHVLREVDMEGEKRWAIVERGPDDESDYRVDDLPPLPLREGSANPPLPEREGQTASTPPDLGGVPLPLREGTPPAAGGNPSIELERKEEPLNPRDAGKQGNSDFELSKLFSDVVDWSESRHQRAIERTLRPIFQTKRVSGAAALLAVQGILDEVAEWSDARLDKIAKIVLTEARGVGTIKIDRLRRAVDAVRRGGAMVVVRRRERPEQWAAWKRHYEATSPVVARLMHAADAWQVPDEWPPARGSPPPHRDPTAAATPEAAPRHVSESRP